MTIGTNNRNDAVGNDSTATYPYGFKIFSATDLEVTVRSPVGVETLLSYPTDYSVTGVGLAAGGNVALASLSAAYQNGDGTLKTGHAITARRVRPLTQVTDIRNQGGFFAATHEDEFDNLTMIDQQQQDELNRSIRVPVTAIGVSTELPIPSGGSAIGWNAAGTALINIILSTGTTLVNLAASTGASLVGFIQAGVGAVLRTVEDKLRESVSAADFGFVPGALATTNTAAILKAIAYATTNSLKLRVRAGTYALNGATRLAIDLGRMSMVGEGSVLFDCRAMTADYAVHTFSSRNYFDKGFNPSGKLKGIYFLGALTTGRHGLRYGYTGTAAGTDSDIYGTTAAYGVYSAYQTSCELGVEDCAFEQFDRNIEFVDNAWRPIFRNTTSKQPKTRHIYCPAGLANAGEVMHFDHCQFSDGGVNMLLGMGQWDFVGCSSLNNTIRVTGDTHVVWTAGNMENPGNSSNGFYYVEVIDDDSMFVFNGGRLVLNDPANATPPGTTWDRALLYCSSAVNGIVLNGVRWASAIANFQPYTTEGNFVIVGGAGRVQARGTGTTANLSAHANPVIALSMNAAMNGGFETATPAITPWAVTPNGAGAAATATAAAKRTGNYGLEIVCVDAGGCNVDLAKIPCLPGNMVMLHSWVNYVVAAANPGSISMVFLDATGAEISRINGGYNAATIGSWVPYIRAGVAPIGTAYVSVNINAQSQTPGVHVYVDDIILNIA